MQTDPPEQSRHQDRSEDKHQRKRPERDLIPKIGQEGPIAGGDARTPESADRHPRAEHRNDAGDVKQPIGDDEHRVSQRQGQCALGAAVFAQPGDHRDQYTTGEQPQRAAADKGQREFTEASADVGLAGGSDQAQQNREQRDRGRVVEQRLAFDQPR